MGFISAWDLYLAVKWRDTLNDMETNPVNRFLLDLDGHDVGLMTFFKFACTIVVLGCLVLLYEKRGSRVHWIMTPIFLFQLGLLYYLQSY